MSHVGLKIRDYRILEQIGEGGMGMVYRALHTRLDKTVALKIIQSDRKQNQDAISRFEREMRAVGKLEHPNIIRALDAGEEQGRHFLVMEYIAGFNLSQLVHGLHFLSLAEACELARQAALGLHHAHENKVVHRDVKPSNLMLSRQGQVKVLDLGLAQFQLPLLETSDGLTRAGDLIGTLLYMAPEQLTRGAQVDARTDIYCLGVTLCELLAGDLPRKHKHNVPLLTYLAECRSDVPPSLLALLESTLSNSLNDRPRSMAEVARLLEPHAAGANPLDLLERLMRSSPPVPVAERSSGARGASALRGEALQESHVRTALVSVADTKPEAPPPAPPLPPPVPPPIASPIPSPAHSPTPSPIASAPAVRPLSFRQEPWKWLALWGAALAVLGLGVLYAVWPPRVIMGTLVLKSEEQLISQLFNECEVYAVRIGNRKQRHRLEIGENSLPVGEYTLEPEPAIVKLKPSNVVVVRSDQPSPVRPEVKLQFPWPYPQIPDKVGATVEYYGTLWHLLLPSTKPITYVATLRAFDFDPTAGKPWRWIEVSVTSTGSNYTETGYLLINEQVYRDSQRMEIKEGWCVAKSDRIGQKLKHVDPAHRFDGLVAPFDKDKSLKDLVHGTLGVAPGEVVSLHEALVLLFGAACPAAGDHIKTLREQIAGDTQRQFEIERVPGTLSTIPCLVIRSRDVEKKAAFNAKTYKYKIWRNDDPGQVPFNFVEIQVDEALAGIPTLVARLKLQPTGQENSPPIALPPLEELKARADLIRNSESLPAPPPIPAPPPPIEGAGKPADPPAEPPLADAPIAPPIDVAGKPDIPPAESVQVSPPTVNSKNSVGLGPAMAEAVIYYVRRNWRAAQPPRK